MLVSLTSRETAIGTNDPPRLTLGWLSSRKYSGHFQQKNQRIPTAGDVIFRFAKTDDHLRLFLYKMFE